MPLFLCLNANIKDTGQGHIRHYMASDYGFTVRLYWHLVLNKIKKNRTKENIIFKLNSPIR